MTTPSATSPWAPGYAWWLMLASVIAAGFIIHWGIAAGLTVLFLTQVARPLDFIVSYLVVVTGASFVLNEGEVGRMTVQLSLLSCAIVVMLVCYAVSMRGRALSLPQTALTVPWCGYLLWSLVNTLQGFQSGSLAKYVGLELIAILALGSGLLVANAFEARRDLRFATVALIVIGFGPAVWGFSVFSTIHFHLIGFYSMAIPGMVGVMLVNLALRAKTPVGALGCTALSLPLFVHQVVTFGRGLWTGCLAGLALSLLVFAGFGRGAGVRWGRVGLVIAMLVGFGLVGTLQIAPLLGQSDILENIVVRASSIGGTEEGIETRSNVIRLWEYANVLKHIRESPLVGNGVGFTFSVRDPFSGELADQHGVHQNFLLVWVKQGLIGLALFVWMLWIAIAVGVREAIRRTDPLESSWFATTAAATIFLVVFSLSNMPFTRVNEAFFVAMLWGGAMGMTRKGRVQLRWGRSAPPRAR